MAGGLFKVRGLFPLCPGSQQPLSVISDLSQLSTTGGSGPGRVWMQNVLPLPLIPPLSLGPDLPHFFPILPATPPFLPSLPSPTHSTPCTRLSCSSGPSEVCQHVQEDSSFPANVPATCTSVKHFTAAFQQPEQGECAFCQHSSRIELGH